MEIDLNKITEQIRSGLTELLNQANLHEGDLVVLGLAQAKFKVSTLENTPASTLAARLFLPLWKF